MGSSCSSAQKKKKNRKSSSPPDSRRQSTESIPYSKEPPSSRPPAPLPKDDPTTTPQAQPAISSPPPGQTSSPVTKESPEIVEDPSPEAIRQLLAGRVSEEGLPNFPQRPREIALYVCADYQESGLEMSALYDSVYPQLWQHCTHRGYSLTLVNPHWAGRGDFIAGISQLCLDTINGFRERRTHLLGLIIYHDSPGKPRPFPLVGSGGLTEKVQNDEVFKRWYDPDDSREGPLNYVLKPLSQRSPSGSPILDLATLKEEWDHLLKLFEESMDQSTLSSHLDKGGTLEREIRELATEEGGRNCVWVQRRFTHLPAGSSAAKPSTGGHRGSSGGDGGSPTRSLLQDRLPDSQKLVFYAKWHPDGLHLPHHEGYLKELCDTTREELVKVLDILLEEDLLEESQLVYPGIERPLHNELCQQAVFQKHVLTMAMPREALEDQVKRFLSQPQSSPLVIHGPSGCGKTVLAARVAALCPEWFPASALISRTVGLTPDSSTQSHLLRSICEQCCALFKEHPSLAFDDRGVSLSSLLNKAADKRPLIILLDGLDQVSPGSPRDLSWLPPSLPPHVSLVLTVTTGSQEFLSLKEVVKDESCYIEVPAHDPDLSKMHFSAILEKTAPSLASSVKERCSPVLQHLRSTELLAHACSRWTCTAPYLEKILNDKKISQDQLMQVIVDSTKSALGETLTYFIIGLFLNCRFGLTEREVLELLAECKENFWMASGKCPYMVWCLFMSYMSPFFHDRIVGNRTLTFWKCEAYRQWAENSCPPSQNVKDVFLKYFREMPFYFNIYPNRRKVEEIRLAKGELFDPEWIEAKAKGTDPYTFLEDISLLNKENQDPDLSLLSQLIQLSAYALRYDGAQIYAQLYGRLLETELGNEAPGLKALYEKACRPTISSLLPLSPCLYGPNSTKPTTPATPDSDAQASAISLLFTIPGDPGHVIALCPSGGKIIVWNIYSRCAVRTLTGVTEPRDLRLVCPTRALVLCNRELKLYDLDTGELVVKLKGVMNQKMAYYGLHDSQYVVALSRNRMYVNMMNLTTGDLETTFKVGEDRFLNSLLVSRNGRICVCGDETQKPFPLLVWDLASRKLLYDLRIPHHEFVTRLAAISDDGHYVVSVCRELHDQASPSFIIVYDLQSGTLFKKWKPETNSCSMAISSQGSCVVNGLVNSWVLVWDLSTGVRRHTLQGHSAPVDQIQLNEAGTRCSTFDSTGHDRSVRVWNVVKGECEAVFTPDQPVLCCLLTLEGNAVVLSLEGRGTDLVTLVMCKDSSTADHPQPDNDYGDPARKGQVTDVSQQG